MLCLLRERKAFDNPRAVSLIQMLPSSRHTDLRICIRRSLEDQELYIKLIISRGHFSKVVKQLSALGDDTND